MHVQFYLIKFKNLHLGKVNKNINKVKCFWTSTEQSKFLHLLLGLCFVWISFLYIFIRKKNLEKTALFSVALKKLLLYKTSSGKVLMACQQQNANGIWGLHWGCKLKAFRPVFSFFYVLLVAVFDVVFCN